jgi:PKD repeat protein
MRFHLRAAMLSGTACLLLAGCGGGGGGSNTPRPPANTTPPTASITAITPAQRVTNQAVTFTGSGSSVAGGTLTYSWNFGDGGTATGATVNHNFATHGNFNVTLRVTDSGGLFTDTSQSIALVAPPTTPTIVVGAGNRTPNTPVSFTASATDPQGGAVTYAWDFGDAANGSGATATHTYSATGNFQVRVTATNSLGLTATSAVSPVAIAWLPPTRPTLLVFNDGHFVGQTLFSSAVFIEPNGLPYTLEWSFGDSGTATATDMSTTVHHTYAAAGSYPVRVTATSAAGQVVSLTRTATVQSEPAPATTTDNVLQPFCAGAFCSATNATTYSGHGVGVWRYHNSTNAAATINVALNGLHENVVATMIFSNGRATAAASVPGSGTAGVSAGKLAQKSGTEDADSAAARAHAFVLAENIRLAANLKRTGATPPAKQTRIRARAAAPPIGTTRIWRESVFSSQTFNLTVAATCPFSTGRNGVIWVDADQTQRGEIEPARVTALAATLCGANGAYERLIAVVGDVWGVAGSTVANYIQDTPELQDLHVIIPGLSQNHQWNGYFSAGNLISTTQDPNSNAALAVVLNGWVFANYPAGDSATRNTLIHELKHLANFYQRSISLGRYHASFLEETSAMLAEDLVSPLTTPYTRTEARFSGYAGGGAGVGYINWTHPEGGSYNLGGSFAGFLHRQYGSTVDRELISHCIDDGTPQSSYDCLDHYINRQDGTGFEDAFARVGASTLGMMIGTQLPLGFGLPGKIVENVPLKPIGYLQLEGPFNPTPTDLGGNFGATTQTFVRDYIDAGQTTFRRDNVVVPAHTTLVIVVSEELTFGP